MEDGQSQMCMEKNFDSIYYLPILTGKGFSLKLKGKVYTSCVRSCLIYGSDTWPTKMEHEAKLDKNKMSMIRWMCGFNFEGQQEKYRD